jgi:hypothetical protein
MGRGNAFRRAFMPAGYGFGQLTPSEEKIHLEDLARRLEEELLLVKERIDKLRSNS